MSVAETKVGTALNPVELKSNANCLTREMIEGLVEEETQSKEMLKENAKHYWKLINGDSKSKFKVGDKVTLDLYPCVVTAVEWKGDSGYVGYVYTVRGTDFGKKVKEADLVFRDVEEETKSKYEDEVTGEYYSTPKYLVRPNGYQFVDENGNIINATKIVLEKKHNDKLKLESTKKVREYWSEYARIFIEIYDDEPNECVLTHLYTLESHRQKGHAKKALAEAELIAKELGCHTAHLKVETNSWMHNWYLRCGYNWNKNANEGYTWLIKNL